MPLSFLGHASYIFFALCDPFSCIMGCTYSCMASKVERASGVRCNCGCHGWIPTLKEREHRVESAVSCREQHCIGDLGHVPPEI